MKFDSIIIGGGLAGLVCGIRLQAKGRRCAIISSGQSALHFSSGSFDLLGKLPDGTKVIHPLDVIDQLEECHPYRQIGKEKVIQYAESVPAFMKDCHIHVSGSAEANHYRMSPMGMVKQTWLTLNDFTSFQSSTALPWKKALIVNFSGFLDFYNRFIADSFEKRHTACTVLDVSLPAIDKLRKSPTEMRSANIARVFEHRENIDALVAQLAPSVGDADVVVLPAVFGLVSSEPMEYLRSKMNVEVCFLPTMSLSLPGIRTQQQLIRHFLSLGGTFMMGDTVSKGIVKNGRLVSVLTVNHGAVEFAADHFVLASGSLFSRGIIATADKVYEPILGLDVEYDADRDKWYNADMFSDQPYMKFGVKTDSEFHVYKEGQCLQNVFAIGSILSGFNALQEACGAGVAIITAMEISERL